MRLAGGNVSKNQVSKGNWKQKVATESNDIQEIKQEIFVHKAKK